VRIILTGGGTGGHIYPALALARYIKETDPNADILYVGTERGLESDIVPRSGLPFRTIEVAGLQRKLSLDTVKTFVKLSKGLTQARKILKEFRPDVVVGTGGYVCVPIIFMAKMMGIKAVITEMDVLPGLANRFLSRFADVTALSFAESQQYLPKARSFAVTGNPRASDVMSVPAERSAKIAEDLGLDPHKKTVLIVCGSRGAAPINKAVLAMLDDVAKQKEFQLVYVTGQVHYDKIKAEIDSRGLADNKGIIVVPFVYDMPALLQHTDMMVGRSGATTMAEVLALGVPALYIPSPYVTNNHQEKNAVWMVEKGAGLMLKEQGLTGRALYDTIDGLVTDRERLSAMQNAARELGRPDAAKTYYQTLQALARPK